MRRRFPLSANHLLFGLPSGEAEFQERQNSGPWLTTRLTKGSFFLTLGGAPYDCRWRTLTSDPFECMLVAISLPLFSRALEEVFGAEAINARLQGHFGLYGSSPEFARVGPLHRFILGLFAATS